MDMLKEGLVQMQGLVWLRDGKRRGLPQKRRSTAKDLGEENQTLISESGAITRTPNGRQMGRRIFKIRLNLATNVMRKSSLIPGITAKVEPKDLVLRALLTPIC